MDKGEVLLLVFLELSGQRRVQQLQMSQLPSALSWLVWAEQHPRKKAFLLGVPGKRIIFQKHH